MRTVDTRVCLFVLAVLLVAVKGQTTSCRTVEGQTGSCTPLYQCTPLQNLSQKPDKKDEDVQYLRRSACGFTSDGRPKVCCPSDWESWTTPRSRITTRTPPSVSRETTPPPTAAPSITREPLVSVLPSLDSENCPCTSGLPGADCCGSESGGGNRISGGSPTMLDSYPWLVLLEYHRGMPARVETNCGGSLISCRYVLTAAHCIITDLGAPTNVRLSEYNKTSYPQDCIETDGGGIDCATVLIVPVEQTIVHPSYISSDTIKGNDIGLLRLKQAAPYTDLIRPICLPSSPLASSSDDLRLFVAGWGSDGRRFSDIKLDVQIPFVALEQCRAIYGRGKKPKNITDIQICAGGEQGKDSCAGDSGGPLMLRTEDDTFQLVGIVSVGPLECGTRGVPAVYTNVYRFREWIRNNTNP